MRQRCCATRKGKTRETSRAAGHGANGPQRRRDARDWSVFFVTAPGRFARGVRFTLGAILHVLHVRVWRANGRRARNALHPKSGIMQCLFGLMLSIRPTCQKYILYCIALSVRPRARNACCMILYCTERTADVPEMRLDYILGNDKMAAASARAAFVQRDADTNRLSDHLPVLFDFKLI